MFSVHTGFINCVPNETARDVLLREMDISIQSRNNLASQFSTTNKNQRSLYKRQNESPARQDTLGDKISPRNSSPSIECNSTTANEFYKNQMVSQSQFAFGANLNQSSQYQTPRYNNNNLTHQSSVMTDQNTKQSMKSIMTRTAKEYVPS